MRSSFRLQLLEYHNSAVRDAYMLRYGGDCDRAWLQSRATARWYRRDIATVRIDKR